VGVPAAGNTGQVLQKLSATSYDTGWLTLPADYITSVTAPLAVTTGNLTIDLTPYLTSATAASTYQTLAGMSSYLTTATAASTYYLQTNPSGFQTAGDVTTALSPYLTSATAASTYAVIAAGQPVAGSAGQVLTKQSGTNWDSIWATPVVGDRYLTTSTTSNTVGNGNKTFTIGTGLSYTPTQNITISYNAANHMHGEVLTYNSGTGVLTVDIKNHTGSGTYAAWVVNVGGVTPATSVAWGAITGTLSTQTDLQNALDLKLDVTTAASTYYLQTNPSGFIDASALTGYATETFVTTQGYITQGTADGLYYPLSGNPSGFLTAGNLAPYAELAGAAFTGPISTSDTVTVGSFNPDPTPTANGQIWYNGLLGFLRYYDGTSTKSVASQAWSSAAFYPLSGNPSSFLVAADIAGKANIASPSLTGTPLSTTAAVDTNTTQIATTAYVVGQGYLKSATAASTYFTIANAANKADLASPALSGTPTAPTATAGTNTTQIATTAFVLANGGGTTFATVPQTIAGTSTTTSLSPALAPSFLTHPECRPLAYFKQTAVSGSGGVTASTIDYGAREMYLASLAVGRAGWMYGITGVNIPNMSRADWRKVDFSKKIWLSGRAMPYSTTAFGASYPGDANTFARITLGGYSTNTTGDMTLLGIGWKKQGGLASVYTLTVHNGTTRTDVATSVSATDNSVIDWVLYSEGNGNVSFYINGTLAASTSAGPTGITAAYAGMYREQVEAATTPTARQILETTGGWLYMEA
jgi:hypothetical protein